MLNNRVASGLIFILNACSAKDATTSIGGSGTPTGSASGAGGFPETGTTPAGAADAQSPGTGAGGGCKGLQCQQRACPAGGSTTVSGTVYDPAGINPLYNVVVYVPNEELEPLTNGASCDTCNALYSGKPIATALTDAAGKFVLENAPIGTEIPLVIQIGKWRRQLILPRVDECKDNPQPDRSLRLPKNRSEGDLPNIAISTGAGDTMECLLRRIGVAASEYVAGPGQGRVHVFQGGQGDSAPNTDPPAPSASEALWSSLDELKKYDIVLLSCEGFNTWGMNQKALHDYASQGGRVFASQFHYTWFTRGPYANENLVSWRSGNDDIGDINAEIVTTLPDGKPFAKGQALKQWLGTVGALTNGVLPIVSARHNADVTAANSSTQTWIVADQNADAPGAVQSFSFNTPTQAGSAPDAMYCGRVVYSNFTVGAASGDDHRSKAVPTGCAEGPLSPQEKALEFMLFDISSCVTPETEPPAPPPPVVL